jgi:hypothetical protein
MCKDFSQRNNDSMNIGFDWEEVDSLIGILYTQGISYLIGDGSSCSNDHGNVDPVHLIQRLAACGYPLVENASISLFILHPELAPSVLEALQSSEDETAENIAVVTLATLYLQQWWFFRLAFALGRLPCFPEAPFVSLWEDRHLPPPDSGYGLHGLLALQRCGHPSKEARPTPASFVTDLSKGASNAARIGHPPIGQNA